MSLPQLVAASLDGDAHPLAVIARSISIAPGRDFGMDHGATAEPSDLVEPLLHGHARGPAGPCAATNTREN